MNIRLLLAVVFLLAGCSDGSKESVALADQEKGVKAKPVDLNALAAARAASDGAEIEKQVVEARSLNANVKAYANKEGEPTLDDLKAQKKAAPSGVGGGFGSLTRDSNAGMAAPSDLDTLDDEAVEAWVNMDVVEQRILGKRKAMQACWNNDGDGSSGRMNMAITIAPSGRASSVSLSSGSTLTNGRAADCVARALRSVSYPEPRGGSVRFVYPVKF